MKFPRLMKILLQRRKKKRWFRIPMESTCQRVRKRTDSLSMRIRKVSRCGLMELFGKLLIKPVAEKSFRLVKLLSMMIGKMEEKPDFILIKNTLKMRLSGWPWPFKVPRITKMQFDYSNNLPWISPMTNLWLRYTLVLVILLLVKLVLMTNHLTSKFRMLAKTTKWFVVKPRI